MANRKAPTPPPAKSEKPACHSCGFWQYHTEGRAPDGSWLYTRGECHRYAPRDTPKSSWPSTRPDDWCGEWVEGTPRHVED